jgi:hypothetical protein
MENSYPSLLDVAAERNPRGTAAAADGGACTAAAAAAAAVAAHAADAASVASNAKERARWG